MERDSDSLSDTKGESLRGEDLGSKTDLIEMVKAHKELYDKNNSLYKNNSHKGVLWASIAKNLGGTQSAKKVREQFSYMRRRFEEEYHARKNGLPRPKLPDPESANYRKPLFVYEQLTFLEPYINIERENSAEVEMADAENNPGTSCSFDDIQSNLTDSLALLDYVRQWTTENAQMNESIAIDSLASDLLPQFKESKEELQIAPPPEKRRRKQPPSKRNSKVSAVTPPSNSSDSPPSQDLKPSLPLLNFNTSEQQQQPGDNEMLLQLAKALTDNCTSIQTNPSTAIEDEECNLFGRQVSMDLKRLNLQNRAIARYRINKILMELTVKECPGGETQALNFD
uniref:MADF domain-containing protein n=1 Tax=Panagrolaimus superbus TaxID=310955 RepID=A0A914Z1R5_9BILA